MALLAGCDLIALPYAPSRESSSAAVRSALASGVPVAVTRIPLFDDVADAVARLPGGDVAAVAEGLAALLADPARRAALGEAATRWLADRAVPDIARRLQGMLRGLAAQRQLGVPLDGTTASATLAPAGEPDPAEQRLPRPGAGAALRTKKVPG
jgi:glycosyltransferase involved in cell wall biosynthesis